MAVDFLIQNATVIAPSTPGPVDDSAAGLMARWATLIREYEAFHAALAKHVHKADWPRVRPYIQILHGEAQQTQRLADHEHGVDGVADEKWRGAHRLLSTTLAAKEGMWRITKTCEGLLALERRFSRAPLGTVIGESPKRLKYKSAVVEGAGGNNGSEGAFVNIVVDNGREWLRVLTTTNAQLMVELAENGWEWGSDGEDEEDDELQDIADMSLVKTALGLAEGAYANRYKGAYPRICIILTRIEDDVERVEGDDKQREAAEISRYLGKVRRGLAARLAQVSPDIDGNSLQISIHTARAPRTMAQPPEDLDFVVDRLLPKVSTPVTPTVNIDTSILIALVSDITHSNVAIQNWHTAQRIDEITRESQKPGDVLKTLMTQALGGRKLVCTHEAANTFRTMVGNMAQSTEKERARMLMGEVDVEREELVCRYRALSSYPDAIPDDLQLPIEVVDVIWDLEHIKSVSALGTATGHLASDMDFLSLNGTASKSLPAVANGTALQSLHSQSLALPSVAYRIAQDMAKSKPTLAVFFYGWAAGQTTITTNLAARNRIRALLERYRTASHEEAPLVWVCRTARSLNGTNPQEHRNDGKQKKGESRSRAVKYNTRID
ncbi:hypothetical protein SEUCBS139899_009413 [Sporothrix eucalyptigena]|uniref:DUF1308 domain-containing protein n=1 Tax=Sporothrix eucalyptigena TaxID=1812306 RepID=A0ABP0D2C6_9PEZI